ncbi:MAG: hypothetical protein JRC86_03170 [Deltaproteobacteria bacterium]|nr:hypothetical protein [Deltaproteobacteria bacterium]
MKLHTEPTHDLYVMGRDIKYPADDPKLKYDFLFTKNGNWVYADSSNYKNHSIFAKHAKAVMDLNEHWRIVIAASGQIVKEG